MRTFDPWSYTDSTSIVISEEQRATLEKALVLLEPHVTNETPRYCRYYTNGEDGDDMSIETCDDEHCISSVLKDNPNAFEVGFANDGDHDSIDRCSICGTSLNGWLTWVNQEFDYLKEEVITIDDIKNEAFTVRAVLRSYPSSDHSIGGYERHQAKLGNMKPLNDKLKRQEDHVASIMNYAELVIKMLSNA